MINGNKVLNLDLEFEGVYPFILDLELEGVYPFNLDLELGTILGDDMLPEWEGPYTIIPKVFEQGFNTNKKKMVDNLVVTKIPYVEVLNPGGGNTATIG